MLEYAFMQRAALEAVLIGGVCAVIGVYVVLNGLSFIGAGISHSAFAGVAIGLVAGVNPLYTAVIFSTGVAVGIGFVSDRGGLARDTVVGIFFAATMALGILLISFLRGYYTDLFGYLFGNILAVTDEDLILSAGLTVVVLSTVLIYYKEFMAISFDKEHAEVTGLPVRSLGYVLLGLIAITVVISVKSVGVVLVSALIVTPAAAALQLTRRLGAMMALSALFGVMSSLAGLALAYWFDLPSGGAIVLLATSIFVIAWAVSPKRRRR